MIRHYSKQGLYGAAADETGNLVDHDGGVEHTVTKETETAWSLYQDKADHVIESRFAGASG
jgi:hypothetical protein